MSEPTSRHDGDAPRAQGAPAPEGQDRAWMEEQAIQDHLEAVLRFARRRLPPTDAEDVAAEAFTALFQARRAGRLVERPGAYLLGVARRRVAERRRRRALGHELHGLPPGWETYCERPLPDDVVAGHELAELVHVALGLLAPETRTLLLARYRDGLDLATLAARAALTPKAVELRLYRARAELRALLLEVGEAWSGTLPAGVVTLGGTEPR